MSFTLFEPFEDAASSFVLERFTQSVLIVAIICMTYCAAQRYGQHENTKNSYKNQRYHLPILIPTITVGDPQRKQESSVAAKKKLQKKVIASKTAKNTAKAVSGAGSRRKGHNFERWVAIQMRPLVTDGSRVRRGLQSQGGDTAPDVEFPGWWIECKIGKKAPLRAGMVQVIDNARAGRKPLLIAKDDYKDPVAMLKFEDFCALLEENKKMAEAIANLMAKTKAKKQAEKKTAEE